MKRTSVHEVGDYRERNGSHSGTLAGLAISRQQVNRGPAIRDRDTPERAARKDCAEIYGHFAELLVELCTTAWGGRGFEGAKAAEYERR